MSIEGMNELSTLSSIRTTEKSEGSLFKLKECLSKIDKKCMTKAMEEDEENDRVGEERSAHDDDNDNESSIKNPLTAWVSDSRRRSGDDDDDENELTKKSTHNPDNNDRDQGDDRTLLPPTGGSKEEGEEEEDEDEECHRSSPRIASTSSSSSYRQENTTTTSKAASTATNNDNVENTTTITKTIHTDIRPGFMSKSSSSLSRPRNEMSSSSSKRLVSSSSNNNSHQLSWKSDPLESYSDWIIEIQILDDDENNDSGERSSSCRSRDRRCPAQNNESTTSQSPAPPTLSSSTSCNNSRNIGDNSSNNRLIRYRIHRNIVGFGPRKSDYLTRLFRHKNDSQRSNQNENNDDGISQTTTTISTTNGVTTLHLKKSLIQVFPMVLDFMYYTPKEQSSSQTLNSEKACCVFRLSEILEIPALQNFVVEFYRKNTSLKNISEFLTNATKHECDRLELVAKAKIGSLITEKPELAGLIPPKFLKSILEIGRNQSLELRGKDPITYTVEMEESQSKHWSKAAYICVSRVGDHSPQTTLTSTELSELFDEALLPFIDPSIALRVIQLDYQLLLQEQQQRQSSSMSTISDSSLSSSQQQQPYTNLQKRCVLSLTNDWSNFLSEFNNSQQQETEVSDALKVLPSHVLADILMKSMNK